MELIEKFRGKRFVGVRLQDPTPEAVSLNPGVKTGIVGEGDKGGVKQVCRVWPVV